MTVSPVDSPTVLLESFANGAFSGSWRFDGLQSLIIARCQKEVVPALAEVERLVSQGNHGVGFIGYEAAPALNDDFCAREPASDLPLVWFAIYKNRHGITQVDNRLGEVEISTPELDTSKTAYTNAIGAIKGAIAAGDTYQVNYTVRQRFQVKGDPFRLYRRMCRNQKAPFCAWIDTGSHKILSASPELFFSLKSGLITMKPMKGTASRLPDADADLAQAEQLADSQKDRAENLMIVDLIRNDLGTIAKTGTVKVPTMFEVETFPTVHQMTSTVTAQIRPDVTFTDILRALFPCGSVTGAPKRRTMEIITGLETSPRGIYCGAIGYLSPGPEAVFSVAIRTAVIAENGYGEMGTGSGVTWGSDPEQEHRECLTKSLFLIRDSGDFQLIESLRLEQQEYLLLDRHMNRLIKSARYFGLVLDEPELIGKLEGLKKDRPGRHKVRILLDQQGSLTEATTIEGSFHSPPLQGDGQGGDGGVNKEPAPIAISQQRVDSGDTFLYHKTTRRHMFDSERTRHPDCYDVIFLNERDEVTEGSFNNLVVMLTGNLLTPTLRCGLLPGVLREELLEQGLIKEAILKLEDLRQAERIWLINSVRGWRECRLKA